MWKILRRESFRPEILGKQDSVVKFRDIPSAVDLLRRFKDDPVRMATVRACVAVESYDAHRLDAEQVLARLGFLLVTGRVVMIRSAGFLGRSRSGSVMDEQESEAKIPAKPRTPRPKSWVEINLRDEKGSPVAGEHFRIKLPDGSVHEGTLDAFGHAEFYEINRGNCEVSFPDLADEEWNKA